MKYDALRDYLRHKEQGGWGWRATYDRHVCDPLEKEPPNYAYLCGHYNMLLDQVLNLLPQGMLSSILDYCERADHPESDK